ncbi:response regulator transcription factor [Peptoniphilus asaccharolyticus]|nr:response regulator transcription factor [Peptoniphilus asaccharolyticus]MBL7576168.1 response regulator transcription factor [Peptoniphilus asaccharolyticus]
MKILVVEDEKELLENICKGLKMAGYIVDSAQDSETAEELCFVENYDLIVLDINLPKMNGFDVLKKVRSYNKTINIILLTARSNVEDRVKGLDLGANDYMVKPFYFAELEARIRSLLRRTFVQSESVIYHGELSFDTSKRIAFIHGKELSLTKKELGILEYLLFNRGRYITAYEIIEHVWDNELDIFSNTVRVHMASLRNKIKNALGENIIRNVIGKGYIIDEKK